MCAGVRGLPAPAGQRRGPGGRGARGQADREPPADEEEGACQAAGGRKKTELLAQ